MTPMPGDKYAATWVSHTSITDFLQCPRAYYLKNVYRDPESRHKIQLMSPPLALGQAVHEVVESLSVLPVKDRFRDSLLTKFQTAWKKISGRRGGFLDSDTEQRYKSQGEEMLEMVTKNPGPLKRLAVKIKADLPYYWLSEADDIILCGKIDWLEYLPDADAVHIIDFKTGKREERDDSLQLPIYYLLATHTQSRPVVQASYWYLRNSPELSEQVLPDANSAHEKILAIAKKIKVARKLESFKCPQGELGCYACRPYEAILRGEAEKVGLNEYQQDVYILARDGGNSGRSEALESEIL